MVDKELEKIIEEEKIATLKRLLDFDMPDDIIAIATNFSLNEVASYRSQFQPIEDEDIDFHLALIRMHNKASYIEAMTDSYEAGVKKGLLKKDKDALDLPMNQQYVKNMAKGFATGFESGLDIGRKHKTDEIFETLYRAGHSDESISTILDMPEAEVTKIRKKWFRWS
ncbi:TPA: hypothetical protein ACIRLG_001912 [Streptococcus suis]